ncbi:exported hypothetical protein [Candidatus Zixiibacteriota bacterium]|nr:exported hypothetical protein [candidate division Zixibacteria bacterium]
MCRNFKITLLALSVLVILGAGISRGDTAPTGKGQKFFSFAGGVALSSGTGNQNEAMTSIHIDSHFGYFVFRNLSVGINVDYMNLASDIRFHHDLGFGPAVIFFAASDERERASGAGNYPYLGIALLARHYNIDIHGHLPNPNYYWLPQPEDHRWGFGLKGILGITFDIGNSYNIGPGLAVRVKDVNDDAHVDLILSAGILKFID